MGNDYGRRQRTDTRRGKGGGRVHRVDFVPKNDCFTHYTIGSNSGHDVSRLSRSWTHDRIIFLWYCAFLFYVSLVVVVLLIGCGG